MEQPLQQKKQRIEYIDLMKGICITLVVILHCGIELPYEQGNIILKNLRMPLYFFLSGLFFKEYNGFKDFTSRKINKLIIPFIFFAIIPYSLLYFIPNMWKGELNPLLLVIEPYNQPLWFLRSLFLTYIIYYLMYRYTKRFNEITKAIVILLISIFAWFINNRIFKFQDTSLAMHWFYIFNIMTSFIVLPYFHIASFLKKKGFLSTKFTNIQILILFIIFITISYFTSQDGIDYRKAELSKNYIFLIISAISGIGAVWCIAYSLKHLIFFSYIGRYSIIVLGTHITIINIIRFYNINNYNLALITLLLMPPIIWLFKKLFPYFTAQKDLFYCDAQGKLHWGWNRK